jgi:hypothetical protein
MTYPGDEPIVSPTGSEVPAQREHLPTDKTLAADPHISPHAEAAPQPPVETDQARVESLRQTTAEMVPDVARIQIEQKDMRNWFVGSVVFIALVLLVAVIGVLVGYSTRHALNRDEELIAQLQQQQQSQMVIRVQETCPLYARFFRVYSATDRARFAAGPDAYDQDYIGLQNSADHLGCNLTHVVPGT